MHATLTRRGAQPEQITNPVPAGDIVTFRGRSDSSHLHGNGNPFLISMRELLKAARIVSSVLLHRAVLLGDDDDGGANFR